MAGAGAVMLRALVHKGTRVIYSLTSDIDVQLLNDFVWVDLSARVLLHGPIDLDDGPYTCNDLGFLSLADETAVRNGYPVEFHDELVAKVRSRGDRR